MKEKDALLVAGEFLKKLPEAAKRLAKRKGMLEADATEVLKNRAQAAVGEKLTEDEKAERIKKAKDWKQKFSNRATHAEGRKELQAQAYTQDIKLTAQGKLRELTASYQIIGKEIPDFLGPVDIQYSPEAAALVLNISRLPSELQEDPYVLYQELMRMEASIDFSSATNEAIIEAKLVRNAVMAKIVEKAGNKPDFNDVGNDGVFAKKFDLYRSIKLSVIPKAPPEPTDKNSPDFATRYTAWQEARTKEKQYHDLHGDLSTMQHIIDKGFINTERELRDLQGMYTRLNNGLYEKFDEKIKVDKTLYVREEADPYIASLARRIRVVEAEKITAEARPYSNRKDNPPVPNRLYYPFNKAIEFIKDPFGHVRKEIAALQQVFFEEGPDSKRYAEAEERFGQLQEILSGDSFFELLEWGMLNEPEKWTPEQIQQFYENKPALLDFSKRIMPEIKTVTNHMRLSYMMASAQDMTKQDGERILQVAKAIGDPGLLLARQRYNGIMDRVIRHYISPDHVNKLLVAESGRMGRHAIGETYKAVRQDVITKLKADAGLFQDNFKEWHDMMTGGHDGKLAVYLQRNLQPGDDQFGNNVERIVDEALMYYQVQIGESRSAIMRGYTSIEGSVIDMDKFQHHFTSSWQLRLLTPSKHYTEGYQKFTADNELRRTIVTARLEGYSINRPELFGAARMEAERTWAIIDELKKRERRGEDIGKLSDPELVLFVKKFKLVYLTYPKRHETIEKDLSGFIKSLKRKDYEKQLRYHMSLPLYEATLDCSYDYAQSSWRRANSILRNLSKTGKYTKEQLDPESPQFIFHELLGRDEALEWFAPRGRDHEGPGVKQRNKFLKGLGWRIRHAPHEYARIDAIVDGIDQFKEAKYNWNRWQEVSDRFQQIEVLREKSRLSQFDYFNGLTVDQMNIARQAFEKVKANGAQYTLSLDEYLEVQKQFAERYIVVFKPGESYSRGDSEGGGSKIEKFTAMRFGRHMVTTVINDIPWFDIDPNLVSDELSAGGDAGDAFSRYFGDNVPKATSAVTALQATYTLNRKELYENAHTFHEVVKQINDEAIGDAGRAMATMTESLTKEKFDLVSGITKNDWETSYEQEHLGTEESPSRNPIEMEHFMAEIAKDGNPALNSPFYWQAAEKVNGVTDWNSALGGSHGKLARLIGHEKFHKVTHFLDKKIPKYVVLFKSKNLVIYFFLLTGIYIGKQAQGKQGEEHSS